MDASGLEIVFFDHDRWQGSRLEQGSARQLGRAITTMKRSAIMMATLCVSLAMTRTFTGWQTPPLTLELEDYASLPITADNTNSNTRAELARVNNMRDEP